MLWCEAGERAADFWRTTPRLLMIVVHAYRRRRAWGPWHTAFLSTHSFDGGFPALSMLTGDVEPAASSQHRETVNLHNLRLWKAALNQKENG